MLLENIFKIEYNTKYLNSIKKMIVSEYKKEEISYNFEYILIDLLKYVKSNRIVCSIELIDSDITDAIGFIDRVENDYIILDSITESGELDGSIIISIDKIERVWCDNEDDRSYKWLYLNNK